MRRWLDLVAKGCAIWVASLLLAAVAVGQPGPIDLTQGWEIEPSEGNAGRVEYVKTAEGSPAMRLHYQFKTGSGFVIARKVIDRQLPANYAFTYDLGGTMTRQTIEFKQLDDSKLNVWWVNSRNVDIGEWASRTHLKRHFEFAWGPTGGDIGGPKRFSKVHAIEVVVTSVSGGEGFIDVSNLELDERPDIPAWDGTGKFKVLVNGREVPELSDGDVSTGVEIEASQKYPNDIELTVMMERAFEIESASVIGELPSGQRTTVQLSQGQADALSQSLKIQKFNAVSAAKPTARLYEVVLHRELPMDDPTGAFREIGRVIGSKPANRGLFPRAYSMGEQSFWTVMGEAEGAKDEALINEDGAIEVFRSGPSLEPFLLDGGSGKLLSWADGTSQATLLHGTLPMPMVRRTHDGLEVLIEAVVHQGKTQVRYTVKNTSSTRRTGALVLALRPFQVNPPWQFLAVQGGIGTHRSIGAERGEGTILHVDGEPRIRLSEPGVIRFGETQAEEVIVQYGSHRRWDDAIKVAPTMGGRLASLASEIGFDLAAGESKQVAAQLGVSKPLKPVAPGAMLAEFDSAWRTATTQWTAKLNRVGLSFPAEGQWIEQSVRANLAYILINKDGSGFQPGSRSYERSWIRDGSMTALSLLEFGIGEEVGPFVEWYAGYQFANGMVPCVVDGRGPDPVKEHDSHGQLIWAIWNVYAYTGDAEILRRQWPVVQKAVSYIQSQRATRMTDEWKSETVTRQEPGKPAVPMRAFYGLMPESISHEGYSAKPMHSHWDNFFTILGLKRASQIAAVLGYEADAKAYDAAAVQMRQNLIDSVRMTQGIFGIDYIPGCVELGDFDATSTTIAVNPCDEGAFLPRQWVEATFERYWQSFVKRAADEARTWKDYTPYEWRVVGTLVKLGQRQRAMEAAEWFARDQYPQGWRHWGEIVWGNPRAGRFIGDMPHTWVGSDFLRSVRTMLVYEKSGGGEGKAGASKDELVILGGIPWTWVAPGKDGRGVSFEGFVTEYGTISAKAMPSEKGVKVSVEFSPFTDGRGSKDFGGVVIDLADKKPSRVTIDGQERMDMVREDGSIVISKFPAVVEIVP
jgi:hypothetical protein